MKTKKYFRTNYEAIFLHFLMLITFVLVIAFSVYATVYLVKNPNGEYNMRCIVGIILSAIVLPSVLFQEISLFSEYNQLGPNCISNRGDKSFIRPKTQLPESVEYAEIVDINIVLLYIPRGGRYEFINFKFIRHPYLAIKDKNGKTHLFGLYMMSKRSVENF
ncbi:MAG: hypothetical protein K6C32_01770 [Bacilli bacterium]|nr:hypothetical protein [Bacilli bacterium]